ncbi:molybdopterin-synthase adenylyltransferase MoeB [Tamlana fucoidanivorans]|uniref:Molybdopterin-synthase adenylyltransferase n=1 Tax=Allotamlana fucoidanivorans TaxID=2583814 RepID=A0A5C4SHW3_9FLAO|nr:molybdopterin-synthase adenylyltransferase MoeB [Tamlana fucoidanivorans]TNJ42932.1 molybdopterin-synthase adenylyltransferase MoeB [Tamlana fucoidanivorans]
MTRYSRHIILPEIGEQGQDKINQAKVLVVGAGGLGCPVLQYLTAAGVGTIGIIDFDAVELSNLQRQVLFGASVLGKNKAIAAKERLQDLNSEVSIKTYPEALTHQNAIKLFQKYDIIIDGSDNFETRYLVNDACILTNKPLVFGAIYKFEGQVSVFNYKNGPSYRCVFPSPPKKDAVPNCADMGVIGVLPGIIGNMQANEVLKIILDLGSVLSGRILYYNALTAKTSTLKIRRNETAIQMVLTAGYQFQNKTINISCPSNDKTIAIADIDFDENIQFIDVREHHEQPKVLGLPVTQLPLSQFQNGLKSIEPNKKKILFCQSGIRSQKALNILIQHNINNVFSLKEGANALNIYIKETQKTLHHDN